MMCQEWLIRESYGNPFESISGYIASPWCIFLGHIGSHPLSLIAFIKLKKKAPFGAFLMLYQKELSKWS